LESNKKKYDLTDTKIAQYRSLFDKFDANGNGQLDNKEIRNALYFVQQDATDGELQSIIAKYDEDKNGYISFPEFVALMSNKTIEKEQEKEYKKIFQSFDKDNNGYLSEKEILEGLMEITLLKSSSLNTSFEFNEEDIKKSLVNGVNKNSKGELNYSDFVKLLRQKAFLPM
jgi:Ca2+-binding EF-hand superfamily protein